MSVFGFEEEKNKRIVLPAHETKSSEKKSIALDVYGRQYDKLKQSELTHKVNEQKSTTRKRIDFIIYCT